MWQAETPVTYAEYEELRRTHQESLYLEVPAPKREQFRADVTASIAAKLGGTDLSAGVKKTRAEWYALYCAASGDVRSGIKVAA